MRKYKNLRFFIINPLVYVIFNERGYKMAIIEYLKTIFAKLSELKPITMVVLVVIILASVLYIALSKKRSKKHDTKMMAYAGISIAIAFLLSYIRLYRFPQGGSITPASMLPLFIFAYLFGAKAGITAGAAYGLIHLIQGAYIIHWAQLLLDYILAYSAVGLAGFFRKDLKKGILVGGLMRVLVSFLSGVIFFGEFAPEGMNMVLYSATVNFLVIGTETIICLVVYLIPSVNKIVRNLKGQISV